MGFTTDLLKQFNLGDGSPESLRPLIERTVERLRSMAKRMIGNFPRIRRWSDTDDILQEALVRLLHSLGIVRPESARKFYGLAATQIRRELLNLVRRRKGFADAAAFGIENLDMDEPHSLAIWTEFHRHAGELPTSEREVFGLIWYGGLSVREVAFVLGRSVSAVKRRWQSARLMMKRKLKGGPS